MKKTQEFFTFETPAGEAFAKVILVRGERRGGFHQLGELTRAQGEHTKRRAKSRTY